MPGEVARRRMPLLLATTLLHTCHHIPCLEGSGGFLTVIGNLWRHTHRSLIGRAGSMDSLAGDLRTKCAARISRASPRAHINFEQLSSLQN